MGLKPKSGFGVGYVESLKSDQNGIETTRTAQTGQYFLRLKSDQNGIETRNAPPSADMMLWLKSDQNGIETKDSLKNVSRERR